MAVVLEFRWHLVDPRNTPISRLMAKSWKLDGD